MPANVTSPSIRNMRPSTTSAPAGRDVDQRPSSETTSGRRTPKPTSGLSSASRCRRRCCPTSYQLIVTWTSLIVLGVQQAGCVASGGGGAADASTTQCVGPECHATGVVGGAAGSLLSRVGNHPVSERLMADDCKYPCDCANRDNEETCKFGVNKIEDGCGCCRMCARQQGDLCNHRDKCDEVKGLTCDFSLDSGLRGICRAREAKGCLVAGQMRRDGENFKMNCSQQCTCQDGRYACSTTCPQELRPPSSVHCRDAQLVGINGRCCREWVCPHSHSLVGPDEHFPNEPPAVERPSCKIETTQWSSCSHTCGLGVSIRVTGDANCDPKEERRLCIVRPCETDDKSQLQPQQQQQQQQQPSGRGSSEKCRRTWQDRTKRRIQFDKCESVNEYELKYCSTCNRHKCCGPTPGQDETKSIEFKCIGEPKLRLQAVMFIKTCKCYKLQECPFL